MMKSQANNEGTVDDKSLTLPVNAGRGIIEAGDVIVCPLLGTNLLIKFCRKRGISIDRERLLRLERLGLFDPDFRVRMPKKIRLHFIFRSVRKITGLPKNGRRIRLEFVTLK